MRNAARRLITIILLAGATVVGLIAWGVGHHLHVRTVVTAAPSPPRLQPMGTPKDLCRDLEQGQITLREEMERFAKATSQGDHQEACLTVSCVVDGYERVVNRQFHPSHADFANLALWRDIEQTECAAGGYLARQR